MTPAYLRALSNTAVFINIIAAVYAAIVGGATAIWSNEQDRIRIDTLSLAVLGVALLVLVSAVAAALRRRIAWVVLAAFDAVLLVVGIVLAFWASAAWILLAPLAAFLLWACVEVIRSDQANSRKRALS